MKHELSETIGLLRNWKKKVRLLDAGIGQQSCILVAGTARSGTTWIGNVVAHATGSRQLFEPFLQNETFNFNLRSSEYPAVELYQPYASATTKSGLWDREIERILQGRVRHWWCDRFNSKRLACRRVVKAVRINLMLDYIAVRWPNIKIVFVVRDPLSVVNSQIAKMKQGWVLGWTPEYVLNQPRLMADWLDPYRRMIESSTELVHQQAMKWCIENLVPLKSISTRENVLVVKYDDLLQNTQPWNDIAQFLANRHWSDVRFQQAVGRVSCVAERSVEQITDSIDNLSHLSGADCQTVLDVVHEFQLCEFLCNRDAQKVAA